MVNLKLSRAILLFFTIYVGPQTAMNAVLAIIADGGRAIVVMYREVVEINYFLLLFIVYSNLKPFDGGLDKPLPQRRPGVGYARPTKPCRWRGERLYHGGDVYCVLVFS
jgi:hypothetical protein